MTIAEIKLPYPRRRGKIQNKVVQIEELIDKFNIPHKEKFEPLFDLEVKEVLLNGTLTIVKEDIY